MASEVDTPNFLTAQAVRNGDGEVVITGTVEAYTLDAKVNYEELPPGIVGSTFNLGVTVVEGSGPMKGHPHPYRYEIPAAESDRFTRINVRVAEGAIEVEIQPLPNG